MKKTSIITYTLVILFGVWIMSPLQMASANSAYVRAIGGKCPPPGVYKVDAWKFYKCECTSYVTWKLRQNGISFHNYYKGKRWSHAYRWENTAKTLGLPIGSKPRPGDVALWRKGQGKLNYGHVAYVESVNSDGSVNISEYNQNVDHEYTTRNAVKADLYIHFKPSSTTKKSKPAPSREVQRLPVSKARYPDGSLVRGRGTQKVYVIKNGRKCHIPDPETFKAMKYDWAKVIDVEPRTFYKIPTGTPLRTVKRSKTYDRQQVVIRDTAKKSKPAPSPGVQRLPLSKPRFSDGSLVRAKGTQKVYVIKNGRKCHIPDPETFKAMKYDWAKVIDVEPRTFYKIPTGTPLRTVKRSR